MTKLLKIMAVCLLATSMVACSSNDQSNTSSAYSCSTLNVFNWGEYIDTDVILDFEDEFNVRVNYSLFESNEIMYTQLLGGNKYDVIIPSDYMIERLIDEDLLQPLDLSLIPNISNLAEGLSSPEFDPEFEYAIPYFWGTVGIVYDTTAVDSELVETLGFNIFLDESIKGNAFMYNSERDAFMIAFKALGYSMNTEDEDEIEDAYQWLLTMDSTIDPSYVTDEVIDGMIYGEKDIAVVYSGDAAYILSENEDMAYYAPASGTNFWVDAMVIPATSTCADLAHEFINYMLDEEVSLLNSTYVGYAANTQYALDVLSSEDGDYFENEAYLPREDYELDETFNHNEVLKQKLADLWIKVKNQ